MNRRELSYQQREWLRRIAKEGFFGLGTRTLFSLERLGLIEQHDAKDAVLSKRWTATEAGRSLLSTSGERKC